MIGAIVRLAFVVVLGQLLALLASDTHLSQRGMLIGCVVGWAIVESAFIIIRRRRK